MMYLRRGVSHLILPRPRAVYKDLSTSLVLNTRFFVPSLRHDRTHAILVSVGGERMYVLYILGSGSLVYLCWFFTSFACVYTPTINWACGRCSLAYDNSREEI